MKMLSLLVVLALVSLVGCTSTVDQSSSATEPAKTNQGVAVQGTR